ncbi:hypothetical protein [Agrobacterium larrymoorei]|uniref:Uncharacterized protein n=1 Tax=Agrobacterium larrymoorei TaxID=160699 RepID=A0A4D7DXF5_9HYPH|nr:hypothetical protein [Agrobacterium larrymoorei]QCJ00969.1 hypothetical protein CFBP5473_23615 [Agrobacterium larrymoorei]QYA10307.1 hypothetical protein J5285_22285 [Agrobacterium larrymoorei]
MAPNLDSRTDAELTPSEHSRQQPGFEIVNDVYDLVGLLTSRLITFKYGDHERFEEFANWYASANIKRIEFSRRLEGLNGNAVQAAKLAEELTQFIEISVDPWLCKFEEVRGNDG